MNSTWLPKIFKRFCILICLSLTEVSIAQDINSFDRIVTIGSPWFIDFADLNGDQIMDMVGVNGNSNADIKIYHGKADGSFELKTTLTGSGEYYEVFLKELNNDNIPDIVAVSNISGIIFLSSPTGYASATLPTTGSFNELATLFGDFNSDGALDIFFKGQLLINNKNDTFTSTVSLSGNGGAVASDFNNDNLLDIVMTSPGNGTVQFYKGKGDGTFQAPLTKVATVYEVIAYDLNSDGLMDFIAKGYNGEIITFYNDATFSFSQTSTLQLNHNYYSIIQIFDIDHNGIGDLVTSNDNHIQYRPILQNGSFGSEATLNVGMGSLRRLIVKDAIGESFPDMIVMSGFGSTKIYSDKLNATLQFTKTEKTYDALPFSNFYQSNQVITSATVSYPGHATPPKDAGSYEVGIKVVDPNYEGELNGSLTITKKTLTVDVVDASIAQGSPIPVFVLSYTGFISSENSSVLTHLPIATTTAIASSEEGEYEIIISGGEDENYAFEYKTGILTIQVITGISEDSSIELFPNPTIDKIRINSRQWASLKIYDLNGRNIITRDYSNEDISLAGYQSGVYILQFKFKNGESLQKRIVIN